MKYEYRIKMPEKNREEISSKVQEKFFSMGFSWVFPKGGPEYTNSPYLYIRNGDEICYGSGTEDENDIFENDLTAEEFLREQSMGGKKVTIEGDGRTFIFNNCEDAKVEQNFGEPYYTVSFLAYKGEEGRFFTIFDEWVDKERPNGKMGWIKKLTKKLFGG